MYIASYGACPMRTAVVVVLVVFLLICLIIAALCIAKSYCLRAPLGVHPRGGSPPKRDPGVSPHVVVDTLNLAHWLRKDKSGPLSAKDIVEAIDRTAPTLKLKHPGRVMYVLKDRETQFNTEAAREPLRKVAEDNGVYLYLAEKYPDPPSSATYKSPEDVKCSKRVEKTDCRPEHSSRARDDFLMALVASRWKCAVLTEDRLRDFDKFRDAVSPFHVYEYAYWRKLPTRDFIRPESRAYSRLRKPRRLRYEDYFSGGGR